MFNLLPSIKKMVDVSTWELQGQIIILSNSALEELCKDKSKLSDEVSDEEVRRIYQTYTAAEAEEMIPEFLNMIN